LLPQQTLDTYIRKI
jgi:hypothetical protein